MVGFANPEFQILSDLGSGIAWIWVLGFAGSGICTRKARRRDVAPPAPGGANQLKQVLYDMADSIGMLRNAQRSRSHRQHELLGDRHDRVGTARRARSSTTRRASTGSTRGCASTTSAKGRRSATSRSSRTTWRGTRPSRARAARPRPAAANERALMLWTLPAGAIKAANEAGAATKVATENGKTVVNFPIASLKATMKLTLDKDNHIEQVESRMGGVDHCDDLRRVRRLERRGLPERCHVSQANRAEAGNRDNHGSDGHQDQHLQPVRHHARSGQYPSRRTLTT